MASSMIWLAARSGIAPSSFLETSMRTWRSVLATITSRPSPTSLRPIFQALPTRLAYDTMSSGCVVATISITTWEPFCCSNAVSLASSACLSEAPSEPVWSMTWAVSGGTGSRLWAPAAMAKTRAKVNTLSLAKSRAQRRTAPESARSNDLYNGPHSHPRKNSRTQRQSEERKKRIKKRGA